MGIKYFWPMHNLEYEFSDREIELLRITGQTFTTWDGKGTVPEHPARCRQIIEALVKHGLIQKEGAR